MAWPPTHVDADAHLLECVEHIDAGVYGLATGSRSGLGTGGMYTKIVAAEMAMRSGTSVVIASGNRENALAGALERTVPATWFPARITPDEGRKRWMLAQAHTAGSVWVDDGACQAVVHGGKSLLPVGIVEVQGTLSAGRWCGARLLGARGGAGSAAMILPICAASSASARAISPYPRF